MSVSSAEVDVAGFGGEASESDGVGLGEPKNGDAKAEVDCADLSTMSNAEGETADMAGG